METTVLANATGFQVGRRGMYGPACDYVRKMAHLLPPDQMLSTGLVDYALGAAPHTGAFVIVYEENPLKQVQLSYYKIGEGPFYVFYTPFHLPQLEIPLTVARAVLFRDATVAPQGRPVCDALAFAKRDMKAGDILDGLGGFACYTLLENYDVSRRENGLPMGVSEGCRLKRNIAKDQLVTYADVDLPKDRLCDKLRKEQDDYFQK